MRKSDTLQLVIIVLAVVTGFTALQSFTMAVFSFVFSFMDENVGGRYAGTVLPYLLTGLLQAVTAWIILTKSKDLALYIYERTGIGRSFRITSNPADVLFILLIVLGIFMLISQLPTFLSAILDAFKSKVASGYSSLEPGSTSLGLSFVRLLLPLILLMFTKQVTNYFADKMTPEDIIIEEDGNDEADLLDLNDI